MTPPSPAILVAVALQLALVLGLLGFHAYTDLTGQPIVLETAPVDPRDLFRGDYHTLGYRISTLDASQPGWQPGQRVHVLLELRGDHHDYVSTHASRPDTGPGQACLRGTVQRADDDGTRLTVRYGIESFFIPEGAGDPPRDAQIDARVKVDRFCRGTLDALLADGEVWTPVRGAGR